MGWVGIALVLSGFFFFLSAGIGLLRFPDCYCRMHATGKADTMGILLSLMGFCLLILSQGLEGHRVLLAFKVLLVALFWFVAGPTATHALLHAAFKGGIPPWTKDGRAIIPWPEGGDDLGT